MKRNLFSITYMIDGEGNTFLLTGQKEPTFYAGAVEITMREGVRMLTHRRELDGDSKVR